MDIQNIIRTRPWLAQKLAKILNEDGTEWQAPAAQSGTINGLTSAQRTADPTAAAAADGAPVVGAPPMGYPVQPRSRVVAAAPQTTSYRGAGGAIQQRAIPPTRQEVAAAEQAARARADRKQYDIERNMIAQNRAATERAEPDVTSARMDTRQQGGLFGRLSPGKNTGLPPAQVAQLPAGTPSQPSRNRQVASTAAAPTLRQNPPKAVAVAPRSAPAASGRQQQVKTTPAAPKTKAPVTAPTVAAKKPFRHQFGKVAGMSYSDRLQRVLELQGKMAAAPAPITSTQSMTKITPARPLSPAVPAVGPTAAQIAQFRNSTGSKFMANSRMDVENMRRMIAGEQTLNSKQYREFMRNPGVQQPTVVTQPPMPKQPTVSMPPSMPSAVAMTPAVPQQGPNTAGGQPPQALALNAPASVAPAAPTLPYPATAEAPAPDLDPTMPQKAVVADTPMAPVAAPTSAYSPVDPSMDPDTILGSSVKGGSRNSRRLSYSDRLHRVLCAQEKQANPLLTAVQLASKTLPSVVSKAKPLRTAAQAAAKRFLGGAGKATPAATTHGVPPPLPPIKGVHGGNIYDDLGVTGKNIYDRLAPAGKAVTQSGGWQTAKNFGKKYIWGNMEGGVKGMAARQLLNPFSTASFMGVNPMGFIPGVGAPYRFLNDTMNNMGQAEGASRAIAEFSERPVWERVWAGVNPESLYSKMDPGIVEQVRERRKEMEARRRATAGT